ncbi:MAG TPA: hypothetical protein VKA94_02430 [Hyphomicrobiales bacterium]|nr:hypothetical protein [Hyphomicrobiales bacterium]
MAYVSSAEFFASPRSSEKSGVSRRIFDALFSSRSANADNVDVNALKDWDPAKLRSFGYTDVEIDYLFAKANQSK